MTYLATPQPRTPVPSLCVGERVMEFGHKVHLMGVLNVTPDSFSDGGQFFERQSAIEQALQLVEAGADIIDVGGESTRPGAQPVNADEEMERVIPVIEEIRRHSDAWISVDTYKADVAEAAVAAGAHLVNDISGLGFDERMASTVADAECGLVLMHIRKTPATMQNEIHYDDLIGDITSYFKKRLQRADEAGIDGDKILLDPGIGFGKTVAHNYRIIRELAAFRQLKKPLLVGTSRKSFIGAVTDRGADERLFGTAATVACAVFSGADVVRVHDVAELNDVVRVAEAVCAM